MLITLLMNRLTIHTKKKRMGHLNSVAPHCTDLLLLANCIVLITLNTQWQ